MSPLKWWVGHAGFSHLRHTAQGTQVLNQLLKDPTKIMGLACLLFFRLGQTKMSHKYQKASNMQICTAKNQNIYPTPACWRIQLHQQNSWVTPVWAPSFLSPSRLLGMKVLGFLSENCLQGLSISCVNFQERDGRKLWSFTFLSNPSCWRKLTFSPPPLFLSFSWEKEICTHSSRLSASHVTTSLEDNSGIIPCCSYSPKGQQPRWGAGEQLPAPQPQSSQHQLQNRPRVLLTSLCSC